MTRLAWSDAIGKRVRTGDWDDQAVATLTKIEEELAQSGDEFGPAAGRREAAAQLVDYFMEEAKSIYLIYKVWMEGFEEWQRTQGVDRTEIDAELARLCRLLAYPDGTPFDSVAGWRALGGRAGQLANGIRSYDLTVSEATSELEELREQWRTVHDRFADLTAGILAFVVRRFGEAALEDCYRSVLEPYFDERYNAMDLRYRAYDETIERNLYLSLEGMRAHLVGPDRRGDIELEEFEDRWQLRFDPCGSGGRMLRGDPDEGTPSRVLAPYEFGVTQDAHPWSWNEVGVCYYCAHCNLALSTIPADRWGHPIRTVDPPLWRGENAPETRRKCQWTVWKSIEAIPEREYQRIGKSKPRLNVIR